MPESPSSTAPDHCVWEYSVTRRQTLVLRDADLADGPDAVAGFLRSLGLAAREQEHFLALLLDTKHRIKGFTTVTVGLVDRSQVHAREVFRTAVMMGTSRVILAHNHPSGDPAPSPQDIAATRSLVEAGKVLGIEVLDHVILGLPSETRARDYLSFREEKLL